MIKDERGKRTHCIFEALGLLQTIIPVDVNAQKVHLVVPRRTKTGIILRGGVYIQSLSSEHFKSRDRQMRCPG